MKPRADTLYYDVGRISLLVQSPLRIHIHSLNLTFKRWDESSLGLLQYRMGHLEECHLHLRFTKAELIKYASPVCFSLPRNLKELSLDFELWDGCNLTTEHNTRMFISECMKQIATQSRLVKLHVDIYDAVNEMDCPSELRTLSTLTDLSLPSEFNLDQTIDLVKELPLLRRWFSQSRWTLKSMQRLADGIELLSVLEDVGSFQDVDEPMANELKRLSNLTRLSLSFLKLRDLTKLLPFFPRLSYLSLLCQSTVNLDHLCTALSTCSKLTDLSLTHPNLTSDHLSRFLPDLIFLKELKLFNCHDLTSLQFLTAARTSLASLTKFWIYDSKKVPMKEYRHLRAISPTLQWLTIDNSCTSRFDELTIDRWTPGSIDFCREEWPQLEEFELRQSDGEVSEDDD